MLNVLKNHNKLAVQKKRYIVKTSEEAKEIILNPKAPSGSTILILTTGEQYILNAQNNWVEYTDNAVEGINEIVYEGGELSSDIGVNNDIIYDGGDLGN